MLGWAGRVNLFTGAVRIVRTNGPLIKHVISRGFDTPANDNGANNARA